MSISIETTGDFKNLERWFGRIKSGAIFKSLEVYAQRGVDALSSATPIRTGETANAWYFEVSKTSTGYKIEWRNRHVNDGVPIALIIQLGHGTGTGGYVQGIDYINPAIQPVFQEISDAVWKEVTN